MMQNNQENSENPNLFPIILHEGVHVVDSRLIAEALGLSHSSWFTNIVLKYKDEMETTFGILHFQNGVSGKVGHPQRYVLLIEDQAIFLATLSRNTPQVIAFKAKLVASFAVLRQDFAKVWELYQELTQELQTQEEWQNNNVTAIEDAMRFLLDYCRRLEKTNVTLKEQFGAMQVQFIAMQKQMHAQNEATQKQIKALQEKQKDSKGELNKTTDRVDKIEEHLELKAVACVYLFFCPRKGWYKLGSSHDAKGRKRSFSTIEATLKIILEIYMFSREEAYTQENALQKRFIGCHKGGEWYDLTHIDLNYLHELAKANREHLANMK